MNATIVPSLAVHLEDGTTVWVNLAEFNLGYDGEVFHAPCSKEWNLGATATLVDDLEAVALHAIACPLHTDFTPTGARELGWQILRSAFWLDPLAVASDIRIFAAELDAVDRLSSVHTPPTGDNA